MTKAFAGKTALITGGASGLGYALACQLRDAAAHPISLDIRPSPDHALTNYIADVRDSAAVTATVQKITADHGPIDLAIANAGIDLTAQAHHLTPEDWRGVIETNLIGATNLISAVYPGMVQRRSGQIAMISSGAGLIGFPTGAPYTAAKAGLIGLVKALRSEASRHNVHVNIACPPILDTPLLETGKATPGINRAAFIRNLPGGVMPTDKAAQRILKGLAKNNAEIIFPVSLNLTHKLVALFPQLGTAIHKDILNRFDKHAR